MTIQSITEKIIKKNNYDGYVKTFDNIDSSVIKSIAYFEKLNLLVIEFTQNKFYSYYDFRNSDFIEFINSPSKGVHFNTQIRNYFDFDLIS